MTDSKKSVFLATTALKQFWNISHPRLLLAGEWCRLYGDKQSGKIEALPFIWNHVDDVYNAQQYCDEVYETVLDSISKILNKYLQIDQDIKYYRIILGNWLIHFIHQAYDKYRIIKEASKLGSVETYVMDTKQYDYPFDFLDYNAKAETDIYQLQLFSQVAKYMGVSCKTKKLISFEPKTLPVKKSRIRYLKERLSSFKYLLYKYFSTNEVVIVGPYFKKNKHIFEFKLWLKSKAKISFDPFNYYLIKELKENNLDFRNNIKSKSNNFDDWIIPFIMKNIPQTY